MPDQFDKSDADISRLHAESYDAYLKTDLWRRVRQEALERCHHLCEFCKRRPAAFVHFPIYNCAVLQGARPDLITGCCWRCLERAQGRPERKPKRSKPKRPHVQQERRKSFQGSCQCCRRNMAGKGKVLCKSCRRIVVPPSAKKIEFLRIYAEIENEVRRQGLHLTATTECRRWKFMDEKGAVLLIYWPGTQKIRMPGVKEKKVVANAWEALDAALWLKDL